MALKTTVKVGGITNLSDARYCAGMGVEMLGFSVIEHTKNYISPKQYQEIRGWITGPQIVAEVYGIESPEALPIVVEQYRPDYLEMGISEFEMLKPVINLPVILRLQDVPTQNFSVDFLLVTEALLSQKFISPVLLEIQNKQRLDSILTTTNLKGIALSGSQEIRPGLKDYVELAEILEALETDD